MTIVAVAGLSHWLGDLVEPILADREPDLCVIGIGAPVTPEGVRQVIDQADAEGASGLVLVSTAMVYGAWPDNPVPLTEDAPLRPNPGCAVAADAAEMERLAAVWAEVHPDVAVAVLRPCTPAGPGVEGALERFVCDGPRLRGPRPWPAVQFIHPDDLAAAVALAVLERRSGVFNVAPDGWLSGEEAARLGPGRLRLSLPESTLDVIDRKISRPAVLPFLLHPWVIANDRITEAGWRPVHRNEEALVAGSDAAWWERLSLAGRQLVVLGATAGAFGSAVIGGLAALRLRRRR